MNISEIFYSIQGEGLFLGVPSVFVRVSGCNLRCAWCDTPHTSWKPEHKPMAIREIVATVCFHKADHVVITGGEPMLFPGQVGQLVDEFQDRKKIVTIETNGTVYSSAIKPTLWSVSPKLSNSVPQVVADPEANERNLHLRNNQHAELNRFVKSGRQYQFKFVVQSRGDMAEIEHVVRENGIPPNHVILMPEGRTPEEVAARGRLAVELAKETGFRVTPRYHIDLWGNMRGV